MIGKLRSSTLRIDWMRPQAIIACMFVPLLLKGGVEQVDIDKWKLSSPIETRPGDLVCRRDNGVWSWFFVHASTREKRFSHVGIIVVGGKFPLIVHADANELTGRGCVRQQTWAKFFSESIDGALYRYSFDQSVCNDIAHEALGRLSVPFDTGFDMENTNKLYCTELVRESVNAATTEDSIGYTWLRDLKRLVAVDDCYKTNAIKLAECSTK